ncbi:MAG TPA: YceI family protein [Streptosporangiaceae bacterium]|jgi:polyisoprenoid-binding protein YceI
MQTTPQAQTAPRLGRYDIDTDASAITFRTRHMFGLAPVRGSLAIRSGTVEIREPPAASSVRAEIDTASFRTGNGQRDSTVRSATFLAVSRHPVMTFTADLVDGDRVDGTLTVRGVSQPVSLVIGDFDGSGQSFSANGTTRLDRTSFGLTAMRGLAGRFLDISIRVSCVRK